MQLQQAVSNIFGQLSDSLETLNHEEFARPCINLSQATIGQHVRHIIEMFQCLELGYESGVVNYENRRRDKHTEQNKDFAIFQLKEIEQGITKADKPLLLEGVYNDDSANIMQFPTNYYREIVYNLEHTIHHMALIRVGLKEITQIDVPETYGVASATVKYKRSCAQ
jgi:hypothetical protein